MNRRRYFILIFAVLGVILAFVQRLIFYLLVPYGRSGAVLRPLDPVTLPRIYAASLVGPALFLAAIAAGLLLTLGTPAPHWTRKRWPWAIGVYYLLHLPVALLPAMPPWSLSLFGRWGFLIYFGLSFLGLASAIWILSRKVHLALPLIVILPVLPLHFFRHRHFLPGVGFSSLATVIVLALAGWWLRDAAGRFDPPPAASPIRQATNPS